MQIIFWFSWSVYRMVARFKCWLLVTVCVVSGHLSVFATSFAFVNNCVQNCLVLTVVFNLIFLAKWWWLVKPKFHYTDFGTPTTKSTDWSITNSVDFMVCFRHKVREICRGIFLCFVSQPWFYTTIYGWKSESVPTEHWKMANFMFKHFPAYYTSFETANSCGSDAFMIHDQVICGKE